MRRRQLLSLAFLAPRWHREYVRSHPGWPWVTLGLMLGGLVGFVVPEALEESAIGLTFPEWVFYVFSAIWLFGGAASTFGLLRGRSDIEVAGLSLIASGLVTYYIAVVSIRALASLLALFILFLAIGAIARTSYLVASGGYAGEQEQ